MTSYWDLPADEEAQLRAEADAAEDYIERRFHEFHSGQWEHLSHPDEYEQQ
ncbi:hypothetical protein MOQ72_34135 [Saccharopolyspora sp. K220]|uniref:hypothetical protein n=1 Tax=Saccharopolyspora soli TaxID=2926618 RepID=UPI001F57F669|nr:hypothetical protein [Saccharopolyspora soli]MCI2422479.1 hypothetical protein [Saccharopolyspora soli]